ncbi:hypothetical protein NECAME_02967 [Necator americanus]|uniref:Uncharacterized protein n=1 Tax=Necator americanus TaxID=51031 RepID=W2TAS0_NECAM|nr:hypothetical protein NECAME_02967 [Necator americanus]ETN78261.1 hypothetical protein NECAME_02967 [Necator americanus]
MGQRSVYDPRDPWAFRNTWTGEIRNSYDDLWIWATLIIALTIIAVCILVPVLIHIYCKDACFRFDSCRCFEQLLTVCYTTSWEKRERSRRRRRATTDYSLRIEESISRKVPKTVQLQNFAPYWQMVDSDPVRRSYPSSFYPRSFTVPTRLSHICKRRFHSEDRERQRCAQIPRLKLRKM